LNFLTGVRPGRLFQIATSRSAGQLACGHTLSAIFSRAFWLTSHELQFGGDLFDSETALCCKLALKLQVSGTQPAYISWPPISTASIN
jgi:hypothetical protein